MLSEHLSQKKQLLSSQIIKTKTINPFYKTPLAIP